MITVAKDLHLIAVVEGEGFKSLLSVLVYNNFL